MPLPWGIDVRTTFHVPKQSSQHAETSPQKRERTVKASLRIKCAQAEILQTPLNENLRLCKQTLKTMNHH